MTLVDTSTSHYLQGIYEPIDDERIDLALEVIGTIPQALRGSYLRNGPNPQFTPLGNYHVFDGDGMVHAIQLSDGTASYRNRWIESAGLKVEREAHQALFGGLGEFKIPDQWVIDKAGIMKNTANTNIIHHGTKTLALMEAARPMQLDGELATIGEYDFAGQLQGPMTAHPRIDPTTGDMHFFGYSPFPPYLRYHVAGADGTLRRTVEVPIDRCVMIHDFVVTETHAVFFDLPAVFDLQQMLAGGAGIQWRPETGARIGVMPLDGDGSDTLWIDIDPCYVFHFVNAYNAGSHTIVVDGCRATAMPTSFGDDPEPDPNIRPYLHRWTIDLAAGTAHMTQLDDRAGDFPRINDAYGARQHRYGYVARASQWAGSEIVFDAIVKHDFTTGSSSVLEYGSNAAAGEAVFAPDPNGSAEDDGWLLNFVTDRTSGTTEFVIADARSLDVCARVQLPRRVPFGFHGNWIPELAVIAAGASTVSI